MQPDLGDSTTVRRPGARRRVPHSSARSCARYHLPLVFVYMKAASSAHPWPPPMFIGNISSSGPHPASSLCLIAYRGNVSKTTHDNVTATTNRPSSSTPCSRSRRARSRTGAGHAPAHRRASCPARPSRTAAPDPRTSPSRPPRYSR